MCFGGSDLHGLRDVFRVAPHRSDTNFSNDTSFIGRLHRFFGTKVVNMSVLECCSGEFSHLTVCTIQDGTASYRRISCSVGVGPVYLALDSMNTGGSAGLPNATKVYDEHAAAVCSDNVF